LQKKIFELFKSKYPFLIDFDEIAICLSTIVKSSFQDRWNACFDIYNKNSENVDILSLSNALFLFLRIFKNDIDHTSVLFFLQIMYEKLNSQNILSSGQIFEELIKNLCFLDILEWK